MAGRASNRLSWPRRSRRRELGPEKLEQRALLTASWSDGPVNAAPPRLDELANVAPAFVTVDPTQVAGLSDDGRHSSDEAGGVCPVCGSSWCVAHVDPAGKTFYVTAPVSDPPPATTGDAAPNNQSPSPAELSQTFLLHSRPSATKVIYLDFNGHTTTGTSWNTAYSKTSIVTPEYSIDNVAGFSNAELGNIQDIWARVVEDFAPFDVDVTTEEPSLENLRNSGGADTRWGIRVAIGGSYSDWFGASAGGVAYLTSFAWDSDTPCFVFENNVSNGDPKATAECISHEVGHTLGLNHDGRNSPSEGYYGGHGTGATGWAPIMGVGYYKELVQWSKGEYTSANNKEDDLQIITTNNGFDYRADDYGNTSGTAYALTGLGATPTTMAGVIERSTDVDVFSFTTLDTLKATISPAAISPNLDVLAEIWSAGGQVLYTSNPADALNASFDLTVSAGSYFLAIRGTGKGDPLSTGYTNYASLGQYTMSLTVNPPPTSATLSIAATSASKAEGNSSTTPFTFTVTRTGPTTAATTANWAVSPGSSNPATTDDFLGGALPSGSLTFAIGETSKTVTVDIAGDLAVESDESFSVVLSNVTGGSLGTASAAGTIVNDDTAIAVAATSASKAEGNSGTTPFTFTVTRTGLTSAVTTVNWSAGGGLPNPATADDFAGGTLPNGTLTFAAGETTKTITVNVAGDSEYEADEAFTISLSNATGASVTTATASGTIINDDTAAVASLAIAATSASKAEGNADSTPFTFTVTRSGPTTGVTSVDWAVVGGLPSTATADDFAGSVLPTGSLTFAVGETTKLVTINVAGDLAVEADELFVARLSNATGGSIVTSSATGTIINDDASLAIAATSANREEGNAGPTPFTFTVTRSGATGGATTVDWVLTGTGANAASDADFTDGIQPSGSLAFAAGETSKTITVNVNGDTIVEADEGFQVTLSNVSGGILGTSTAAGLIRNDDLDAAISITAANVTAAEGNAGGKPFAFTVIRSVTTAGTTTVNWSVRGSGDYRASGDDFVGGLLPGGTLTFAAGETQKTILVNINGDRDVEANEAFTVLLSDAVGGRIVNASATGTITNDDTGLSVTGWQSNRTEGNSGRSPATPFTFNVTRSGLASGSTTVRWSVTGSGSAQANAADFVSGVLPSGSVSFAAGETSKTITVNVNGDVVTEANEGFTVTLSDAIGAQIIGATAAGTILDDDIVLQITPQTSSQTEGNTGTVSYVFNVTRSTALNTSLTIGWKADGSGPLPANAADFESGVLPAGSLTFAVGETSKTITVNVAGDTVNEFDERFALTVFGDRIQVVAASGTIVNDDTAVEITRTPVVKAEGNSGTTPFTFTVTRSGVTTGATSVAWAVVGSGARSADAADFVGGSFPSGTLSFAAGERSKIITVDVAGDSVLEWDEDFTVSLSGATGGSISSASATGKIVNDESAVSIFETAASKKEGNSRTTSFTFTVTRLNATAGTAAVTWTVTGSGTASADAADFTGQLLPSGTLNFAVGEASKTITVSVAGDTELEVDEGFTVTLSNATGCEIQTATAMGTIVSDDAGLAIAATSANQPEGNTGTTAFSFVVTRSGATAEGASVAWSVVGNGDSPTNAADFAGSVLPGGTLSFAAGETTRTITVLVAGDLLVERDEGFTVQLANAFNAKIFTSKASGVIIADDTGLKITATAASANEGNAGTTPFTFTVTRSGQTNITSTVNWSVTGSGTAPADAADFDGGTLPSGAVTFAEGETSKVITVLVAGDVVAELEERFAVMLSNAVGGTIESATATGVIRNDDTSLAISPLSISTTEGNSRSTPFTFTVTRSGVTSDTSTVDWAVVGSGAAQATASDFAGGILPSGRITFLPGQTSSRITVNVSGDRVAEADEAFTVTLSAATGAQIHSATAVATIVNDDGPVTSPARTSLPVGRAASAPAVSPNIPRSATSAAFAQLAQSAATSNPYLRPRRVSRSN
jgi:hypothetical protein